MNPRKKLSIKNFHKQYLEERLKSIKIADIVFKKEELIIRAESSNNQIKKGLVVNQKELEA